MKIRLVRAVGTITGGLRGKLDQINNFQSERTAREFTEEVEKMFKMVDVETKTPFWGRRGYFLQLIDGFDLVELMIQKERKRSMAGYIKLNPWTQKELEATVRVENQTAYTLPSCREDILLKRIGPLDSMPVGIVIGNKPYPLVKNYIYIPQQNRIKFS
ncbi:Uncharacterised protein [uncultured archaeon]|nr:Uncharacterised protein [uncultured archaeon]